MNKDLERIIELPEGVSVSIDGSYVTIKKEDKEIKRKFLLHRINITTDGKSVKIIAKNATRRQSKMIGTIWAHIKNMIKGITDGFTYKLEVCNVHFPMNVKVDNDKVIVKSFLGEKIERKAKILPTVDVNIKGSEITVTSFDIEKAGQTAANIEKATRLTGRDRRIFQDGIFITEKCGRKI